MASHYQHDYAAFGARVLRSPQMEAALRSRADKIKAEFEATAPVGQPHEPDDHAGRFRDSARVESGTSHPVQSDLAYARVVVYDPAALSIEFGHFAERDAQGRFVPRGEGVGEAQFIEGSYTLTKAVDAGRDA